MENFKKLKVWSKAHELTLLIYQRTRSFPKDEMYGLTSQIRRASARSARTSQRDAAVGPTLRWEGSFRLLAGQPVNLNTICCWRTICIF